MLKAIATRTLLNEHYHTRAFNLTKEPNYSRSNSSSGQGQGADPDDKSVSSINDTALLYQSGTLMYHSEERSTMHRAALRERARVQQ